jgi:four helix bundle protein
MHKFKDLIIWNEAIELAVDMYKLTKTFPTDERYGLVSQMNRASVSISSNIAEGAGRNNPKEFRQFLGIAQGSLCELESQLIISQKIEFVTEEQLSIKVEKITRLQNMINKLINTIN